MIQLLVMATVVIWSLFYVVCVMPYVVALLSGDSVEGARAFIQKHYVVFILITLVVDVGVLWLCRGADSVPW